MRSRSHVSTSRRSMFYRGGGILFIYYKQYSPISTQGRILWLISRYGSGGQRADREGLVAQVELRQPPDEPGLGQVSP